MSGECDVEYASAPHDLGDADKRNDDQLQALRTEGEHREHRARGDVGGEYHPRPGEGEEEEGHPHEVGKAAAEEALGKDAHAHVDADVHRKQPILVVVMVCVYCCWIGGRMAYSWIGMDCMAVILLDNGATKLI